MIFLKVPAYEIITVKDGKFSRIHLMFQKNGGVFFETYFKSCSGRSH